MSSVRSPIFLLLFLFQNLAYTENAQTKPKAIFQAACWDQFNSERLVYFPWDNEAEKNATSISLAIGSSVPSKPFAYYGNSPIKFFRNDAPLNNQSTDENSERDLLKVAEFRFEKNSGEVENIFLLFLKQNNSSNLRLFSLDLKQGNLPYGSFNCYSQFKSNLFIAYGKQKQVLSPGKSVRFQSDEKSASNPLMSVFTKEKDKYIEQIADFINVSNSKRAILFFTSFKELPNLKRFYFRRVPNEMALGYNAPPLILPMSPSLDENSSLGL